MKKPIIQLSFIILSYMVLTSCNKKSSDTPQPAQTTDTTHLKMATPLPSIVSTGSIDLANYTNTKNFTVSLSKPNSKVSISGTIITYTNSASDYSDTVYVVLTNTNGSIANKIVFSKSSYTSPTQKNTIINNLYVVKLSSLVNVGSIKSVKFNSLPTSPYGTFTYTNSTDTSLLFTPSTTLMYYGDVSLSFEITDGKTVNTFTYAGTIGTDNQIATYNVMSPMFGKLGSASTPTNLKFNSDMTMSSSPNSSFYTNLAETGGTFKLQSNGQLVITANSLKGVSTFNVVAVSSGIKFTNVGNNEIFNIVK